MKILFEDNEIIVVEKEAMEPTQTSNIAAKDLVSKIKNHIHEEKNISNPYVGVVHRLDQPVSGILVFALNEKAAANLSKQVMYSDMKKYYKATVEGIMNVGDVSASRYAFVDVEVGLNDKKIHDIGVLGCDGSIFLFFYTQSP